MEPAGNATLPPLASQICRHGATENLKKRVCCMDSAVEIIQSSGEHAMKSTWALWSAVYASLAWLFAETILHYRREAWWRRTQRWRS
jgi:hypothetical protein